MPKPMTAADHFLAGEKLLAKSEDLSITPEGITAYAARAQAHFAAARLLLDADALRHARDAIGRTGMDDVIEERYYRTLARTS